VRVLLTAAPSTGHIAPMLGVAAALRDAGHEVRLATHPSGHAVARRSDLEVVAAGMSEIDMVAERRRRWPETEHQPVTAWGVRMFTQILAPTMVNDLLPVVDDWRPHLLIHEEGEYGGPLVAARAGVPCVTHGWGSPLRPIEELTALEGDAAPLWEAARIDMPPKAGLYRDGLLNPCPPFLQDDRPGAATAWRVRPTHLRLPGGESGPRRGRELSRPTVYIGFGTVAHFADAPDEIRAAVSAVVRHGLDAVVTTPDESLRRELLGAHGDRVEVRSFVSLPGLLPTCRLVVCHAGAGSALASLATGVPLVLNPRGAPSQIRMADACVRAGVAEIADSRDIDEVVSTVLGDDLLAARCADAAIDIGAMPTAAEVVPALEALVG